PRVKFGIVLAESDDPSVCNRLARLFLISLLIRGSLEKILDIESIARLPVHERESISKVMGATQTILAGINDRKPVHRSCVAVLSGEALSLSLKPADVVLGHPLDGGGTTVGRALVNGEISEEFET